MSRGASRREGLRFGYAQTAAIKFGHAEQGHAEWLRLADEFRQLIDRAGIPTPSMDAAYRYLSPA